MSKAWAKGSTRRWRKIRARVLARDRYRCQLRRPDCAGRADQVHHTLGRAVTGDDERYLVAACGPCNRGVGDPARRDPQPAPRTRW
ncbi:MAG TPA: hypothetical protein VGX25_35325 [Actinophytocola sp.]|uniref:HNH endonuclease n=1 Tax=Actinophytocola sp. TaxID=1872138 RepID=UPI002DDD90B7|nr:hypothetical protein [Actinophytocola sp.]HEV2784686.1 hypothetical protein [Actinophytocola sp.]